ncbi:MAG: YceD family protein [Rhodospirillaceae bacterium]
MAQPSKIEHKSEIERIVDVDWTGPNGTALEIAASDSERAALAKRFGFLGLPAFSARVTVDRRPGGQVVVEGRLRGRIVQACILTLDPVTQDLDETFRIIFRQALAEERDPESGEALVSAQADAPEPLPGTQLDVGEIVAEQLSLAADPYPRRHGVKLEDVLPKPRKEGRQGRQEQRRHPFAGLAALRDKPRRGR